MRRFDAISELLSVTGDELLVSNIGAPSRELHALKDRPENFYMLASMGLASSIGLGIALSQERRVVVIEGDGALLMNLGSLATIAYHAPSNYLLVVMDNGTYGSTGDQETIASRVDLEDICSGAGLDTIVIREQGLVAPAVADALKKDRPVVLVVKVEPGNAEVDNVELDPVELKERFMDAIGLWRP